MKKLLFLAAVLAAATSAMAANPAGKKLADETNAASTRFKLTATSTVSYGVGSVWSRMTLPTGSFPCDGILFGSPSATGAVRKQCKLTLAGGGIDATAPVWGSTSTGGGATTPTNPTPTTPAPTPWTTYYMAKEGDRYTLNGSRLISFGTASARLDKFITPADNNLCIYQVLGDAAPGPGDKFCTAISQLPETKIAEVGASFTLDSTKTVVFGGRGFYSQVLLPAGTYQCTTTVFGDPAKGNNGGCYLPNVGSGSSGNAGNTGGTGDTGNTGGGTPTVSTLTVPYDNPSAPSSPVPVETNQFAFRGPAQVTTTTKVLYGPGDGPFVDRDYPPGEVNCLDNQFPDPAPGRQKGCRYIEAGNNVKVADEGGSFTLSEPTSVAFGGQGQYMKVKFPIGTWPCSTARFGTTGVGSSGRVCLAIKNGQPRTMTTQGPLDASIMTNGVVDPQKYSAVAATFGTDAGVEYRFGPSSAYYYGTFSNTGLANYGQRPVIGKLDAGAPNANGQYPNCTGTAGPNNTNGCHFMTFGFPKPDSLDFSSSDFQAAYIPDSDPDDRFHKKPYYGINNILGISIDYGSFTSIPQINWTTTEGFTQNGADNDFNMDRYVGAKPGRPSWAAQVTPDYKPIASTACTGHGGWCTNTLSVWKNGDITGHGGNTNHNFLKYNFLNGDTTKVPTGISITNSGEFALVTVWDTANTKGQIAVIALAEGCQGCNPNDKSTWYENWGNWDDLYHGLPGLGNYLGAKLVGYVDLPSNMKAPTGIVSSTNRTVDDYYRLGRKFYEPLSDEFNRRSFYGPQPSNTERGNFRNPGISRTGMAMVWSKSEKTVAWVDLRPLFNFYRESYFNSTQATFNAMIANRGPAGNQWPYTFSNTPSQTPVVAKTITLASAPTAGQFTRVVEGVGTRSVIATQDGTMRLYTHGGAYLNNTTTASNGVPADIAEVGTVTGLGRNVTQIIQPADHGWVTNFDKVAFPTPEDTTGFPHVDRYLIAVSRGDRKMSFVRFGANYNSAEIYRSVQDQKIIDPISIFDLPNHGTESYVLSIADYAGRGVHNLMYGRVNLHTHVGEGVGCAPDNGLNPPRGGCELLNNQPFEYGGFKPTPGRPFSLSGQNVN